jgi:hypothetical protein
MARPGCLKSSDYLLDQKECTSSPGGGISAAPCGSCACAIASGLSPLLRTSLGNCVKAKDALPIVLHANAAITAAFREVLWTRAEIMVFSSGWMHRSAERRLANLVSG